MSEQNRHQSHNHFNTAKKHRQSMDLTSSGHVPRDVHNNTVSTGIE